MSTPPQDIVARDFMRRKGLHHAKVIDVEKLEGKPCWYYLYRLPGDPASGGGGQVEVEVFYNGTDWETAVCTFKMAN